MTSNDHDIEQKKTMIVYDQGEFEAKEKNGQRDVNFVLKIEIEDSDAEMMDSSINSIDANRKSSENISRDTDHAPGFFASETEGNELVETNQVQEKEIFSSEIQNKSLETINDSYLISSNSGEMRANLTLPDTVEASNSLTDGFSSKYNGSTQLAFAPEKSLPFSTDEDIRILDTEDLKALPLTTPMASSNPQCSLEQTWPSSQENVTMFEVSEQNPLQLSTKADPPLSSNESIAFISSSVPNNQTVAPLSQAIEASQNSPGIEDSTITATSNKNDQTFHLETSFRKESVDHDTFDFSKRRIPNPNPNAKTQKNNNSCLPPERINNNARACSVLPQKISTSTPKQSGLSRELGFLSNKAQTSTTSRTESSEALFPSSLISRSVVTPGPRKNLEATLITSTNSSLMAQVDPINESHLYPSIPASRAHSVQDSFGSSPSSGISIGNASSPTISEPSPERSKEILLAELKAIRIASITARNTALEVELASKRARLEEITRELKAPAQETVRRHIKLLHDYNDIRDVGQGLIGMIAEQRGVQIGSLYEDYGVGVKD